MWTAWCWEQTTTTCSPKKVHSTHVRDIGDGTFVIDREPMFAAIDCATLASGKVWCWRTDGSARVRIDVTGPADN